MKTLLAVLAGCAFLAAGIGPAAALDTSQELMIINYTGLPVSLKLTGGCAYAGTTATKVGTKILYCGHAASTVEVWGDHIMTNLPVVHICTVSLAGLAHVKTNSHRCIIRGDLKTRVQIAVTK